jgi:hypothetical protein
MIHISNLKSNYSLIIGLSLVSCVLCLLSCRKDLTDTSPSDKLKFSSDSILFDTVFTTIGSTTKILQLYNTHSKKIKISSIRLAGGSNSMFSLNINGTYTTSASDMEIAPHDSMFIFVKVTVNPNNKNNPLIVKDSIFFLTNGNQQNIKLVAWGQDAHFIVPDTHINGLPPFRIIAKEGGPPVVWNNDKPYVIYGYAVVDSTGSLTINEGVKVYLYNNAGFWVYKGGSITVNGTKDNPVIFQGTRLETDYRNIPGQWDRIWLNEGSTDNVINYAVIKNAFVGIQAETLNSVMGNKLLLSNTVIQNCSGFGVLARNYTINAGNCLIDNCGQYGIALTRGGAYDFRNCTLGNYWNFNSRQTPSLVLNNYITDDNGNDIGDFNLTKAYFGNCILWGNMDEEILLDSNKHNTKFNYNFDNCIIKTQNSKLKTHNPKPKQDPLFVNFNLYNFHLQTTSPAKNAGDYNIINNEPDPTLNNILKLDLDGNIRSTGSIDLGAY